MFQYRLLICCYILLIQITLYLLHLVKLYHDIENYGVRFTDDKKGIYITNTYTIDDITFKDYDYMIIEYNHDYEIHSKLASESEWPQRYTNAFNSHLNFEQTEKSNKWIC